MLFTLKKIGFILIYKLPIFLLLEDKPNFFLVLTDASEILFQKPARLAQFGIELSLCHVQAPVLLGH